jgi:tetratricopeptide (TPR) repeat protein
MTWLIWIGSILVGASVLIMLTLLFRKFPFLAAINPNNAPRAAEEKKANLMEQRLRRKIDSLWTNVRERSKPVMQKTGGVLTKAQKKLVDLEHEYKIRSLPVFLNRRQREAVNNDIQSFLDQADAFLQEGELSAAEEKALQAVRFEPRSVPAFELLGNLYLEQKEYGHAKEVYLYLQKLTEDPEAIYDHRRHIEGEPSTTSEDAAARAQRYLDRIAYCYQEIEDWPNAFDSISQLVRLEPNNPKFLDRYIDIAIAYGKLSFAEEALARMAEVNPDNSKISEWRDTILALRNDQPQEETTSDSEAPVEQ